MAGHGKLKPTKEYFIALYKVKITHIKERWSRIAEIVGSTKEEAETNSFYQRRAMRSLGFNVNLEKYELPKYKFEATLLKIIES